MSNVLPTPPARTWETKVTLLKKRAENKASHIVRTRVTLSRLLLPEPGKQK